MICAGRGSNEQPVVLKTTELDFASATGAKAYNMPLAASRDEVKNNADALAGAIENRYAVGFVTQVLGGTDFSLWSGLARSSVFDRCIRNVHYGYWCAFSFDVRAGVIANFKPERMLFCATNPTV
jgi:hypothetical protein